MSILTHRKLVKDLVKDFGLIRNLFTVFGLYHRINMGPVNRTIRKKYGIFWTRVRPDTELYCTITWFKRASTIGRINQVQNNYRLFNSVLYNTDIYLDEYTAWKVILDEPLGESNMTFQAVYESKYISVLYRTLLNNL